jgi:hypothetical protein
MVARFALGTPTASYNSLKLTATNSRSALVYAMNQLQDQAS